MDLEFVRPLIDWHAIAPEIVLTGVLMLVLLLDVVDGERFRQVMPTVAGIGLLATLIPLLTLALDGTTRELFGGAYVVDDFALVLKALFVIVGYLVVLLSVDYIRDGDYYENEYYILLLSSLLGMVIMGSSRDLVSMFIALELLSIPAYMLAAWRKGGLRSNEAGMKYYLMGVFATAVMLYGMSFVFGVGGSTVFTDIAEAMSGPETTALITVGILFTIVGFAFKVSAVPFHTWAPDTYEGAPTPVTAFLSVGSKAAGFVALLQLVFVAFAGRDDVIEPLFWILSAVTMTVGNLIALRQTNIVRMLAYSSVAQGGFMLAPFAVAGAPGQLAVESVVIYMIIYAFMNLVFAVVVAVARKTRSGDIASYGGLINYAPGLAGAMTVFLFALAGIPPLAGWFAKFAVSCAVIDAGTAAGYTLGVIIAVNSVIALVYYANVAKEMWFNPVPDGDDSPVPVTGSLGFAIGLTALATVVFGIVPGVIGHFGEISVLASPL